MNKVTTINLNGKAYQLEEAGYELLKKYLEGARKNLADDPDRDEVLADFERAIAEKCDSHLNSRKNVITAREVTKIIDDMGPVEPAGEGEHIHEEPAPEPIPPTKRLYTLPDRAMIGGVAAGLAEYLNIDVNIVRLLFVLLVFVTSGIWIFVYLLMMIALPEARTPEQKAELRGERFTAQDVLDRAKQKYAEVGNTEHWRKVAEQNRPMLSNVGRLLAWLTRVAALVSGMFFGTLAGVATAIWISTSWWLAYGIGEFDGQLSTISHWTVALGVTAAYFVAILPLGVLTWMFMRIGANRPPRRQSLPWLVSSASLWVVALGVLIGVAAVTSGRISDYQATHARVNFDNHSICINENLCGNGSGFDKPVPQPAPVAPPASVSPGLPVIVSPQ